MARGERGVAGQRGMGIGRFTTQFSVCDVGGDDGLTGRTLRWDEILTIM